MKGEKGKKIQRQFSHSWIFFIPTLTSLAATQNRCALAHFFYFLLWTFSFHFQIQFLRIENNLVFNPKLVWICTQTHISSDCRPHIFHVISFSFWFYLFVRFFFEEKLAIILKCFLVVSRKCVILQTFLYF